MSTTTLERVKAEAPQVKEIQAEEMDMRVRSMAVMGRKGDTKTMWRPAVAEEILAARAAFDILVKERKFLAWEINHNKIATQVQDFNPYADEILVVPPMQGGSF